MDFNYDSLSDQKDFNDPMQSIPTTICEPSNSNVKSSQEHTYVSGENCTNHNIHAEYSEELKILEENFRKLHQFAHTHPFKHMVKNIKELNAKISNIEHEKVYHF
ncbi:hypothetical protein QE152_g39516 [Popillia japonica]|uniref:Uncharacterized protein n=1 Tax=Popillia japonica TaxID=7064 RepID=A0AAW1HTU0_POPJA